MAGGKASPRQKMINMMYLVLTAMLALNVSAEILKAFYLVEQSMVKAGTNIDSKNGDILREFQKSMKNSPEKTKPFNDKALQAEKITVDFVKYVEDLKMEIMTDGGKIPVEQVRENKNEKGEEEIGAGQLLAKDNISKHANLLVAESGPKKGAELALKINETRNSLLKLLKDMKLDAFAAKIEKQSDLKTEISGNQTWEAELFEHSPQAAVVTLLTKIQNDAKNTEAEVLNALLTGITKDETSFDMLVAKIIPAKTSVGAGEEFEADVILTAYDSKQSNKVVINGKEYTPENGVVKYKTVTGGVGDFNVKGMIEVPGKDGMKSYPFETEYSVYKGAASISAEKMNMLYIGLDNPVTVAIPGAAPEKVRVSMQGGTIRSTGGGKYTVTVTQRGTAKIIATVDEGGKAKSYNAEFRVRPIPKPEAKLGTLESGVHAAGSIQAQMAVYGSLGEGFAYEGVKFSVTKYIFVYAPKKGDAIPVTANSGALPGQARSIMTKLKSGDRIIISDIYATGPGGAKPLNPIVITVR